MEFLRVLVSRCTSFFHKQRLDRELDEELKAHVDFAIEENLRRGMSEEDARTTALRDFGGITQTSEQYRIQRGLPFIEIAWQDVAFGLRQLRKSPGFALTAILSLALGIGATVSVFSITYAVLVNPYPYADADRIVYPLLRDHSGKLQWHDFTGTQFHQLEKLHSMEKVSGRIVRSLALTGHDVPENIAASCQTGDTFPMLGVPPLLGRNLGPSDSPYNQEPQPVVMLNYKFWQRYFNGGPSVVGQTLELDHKKYTIVGVTQSRFGWGGNGGKIDVYLPQQVSDDLPSAITFYAYMKLRPGVTRATANAELQPLLEQFVKETPASFPQHFTVEFQRLKDGTIRELGGTLYLLFGAVSLLLLIGCANVSILLLARGTARQQELAVRSAVGASASRIFRQLLTESLVLSSTGAALGVLLAYTSLGLIVTWLPPTSFPNEAQFHVSIPVLIFSVGLALLTGILFGVLPALQLAKPEINQVMQAGTHKVAGSMRGKSVHGALIAGQIALTLVLLTAASAAIGGFLRMMRVPLGYDPHNVMSVNILLHENSYAQWAERVNYFERLREKVAELPDVESTGISTNATPPDSGWNQTFELLGKPSAEEQKAAIHFTDQRFFDTLHIPLLQGRIWSRAEVAHGATLVLVNQTFARLYYPNGNILGHSLKAPALKSDPPYVLTGPGSDSWMQIIGVVADSLNDGLDKPVRPAIYMPYGTFMITGTQILIRSRVDPRSILHSVKQQIASINPDQQVVIHNDGLLEAEIKQEPEWARGRLISNLFAAFAVLALALAAVGLYSVTSYSVVQRTNEFGIRMALGAQRHDVFKSVLSSAGVSVGIGVGIGLTLSISLGHLISHWVAISTNDPIVITAASLLLLTVAILACLQPARRAASVDPMTALRCE
jgi:putative ABC transport system permease protein